MKYERSSARCKLVSQSEFEWKCWIFCWIYLFQFNEAIYTSKFSAYFKFTNVTLQFKQDSRNQKNNYRPISILLVISKIFEKLICRQLLNLFDNILSKYQCGFKKGYTLQHCLILMINKWKKTVDNKLLGALLADLSKAFDCILSWFTCSKIKCLRSVFSCFKNDTGLCDNKRIRTHNLFVRKQILKHLAKQVKWLWVWIRLLSLKLQIWCLFRARSSLVVS